MRKLAPLLPAIFAILAAVALLELPSPHDVLGSSASAAEVPSDLQRMLDGNLFGPNPSAVVSQQAGVSISNNVLDGGGSALENIVPNASGDVVHTPFTAAGASGVEDFSPMTTLKGPGGILSVVSGVNGAKPTTQERIEVNTITCPLGAGTCVDAGFSAPFTAAPACSFAQTYTDGGVQAIIGSTVTSTTSVFYNTLNTNASFGGTSTCVGH